MKVLFVASGNKSVGAVSAFVQSQYDSLVKEGVEMRLFPVVGHGVRGYLKNLSALRRTVKEFRPDIIHAHYSTCGYLAELAACGTRSKVVVSLLGSFPEKNLRYALIKFCVRHVWDATIVKSERTRMQLGEDVPVIPNGVNLDSFQLKPREEARKAVSFEDDKKYVIFVSNPDRVEKNYPLAAAAVARLSDETVELYPVFNKTHDEVVDYMCAADALLMTSLSEGSPNVIKEAMACNCPLVVTDVGDVRWVTEGVEGCHVADTYDPAELARLLQETLLFGRRTTGRERILSLGLTTESVARKIIAVYTGIL
jgi:glycosyltransferase involved in cell wall biosynthesis